MTLKLISGFGWFVWIIPSCGDIADIVKLSEVNNVKHLLPKIANGTYPYNKTITSGDMARSLTQAAQAKGIDVWGWQYVYLYNPVGEADMAVQRIKETGCTGFVIDAEKEWKNNSKKALDYLVRLRSQVGWDFPLALSSYRFPSLHPEFPWNATRQYVDLDMPQVYWEKAHDPSAQLAKSHNEFMAMPKKLPYLPTGAAYKWDGWRPTLVDIQSFYNKAAELEVQGYNFWSWQHAKRDLEDIWGWLMPNEEEQYGDLMIKFKVLSSTLNVREGPGLSYTKLTSIPVNTIVNAYDARVGKDSWVKHDRGGWSAVYLASQGLLMEQVF